MAAVVLLAAVGTAQATHAATDTLGHTTVEQRVDGGDPSSGYQQLGLIGGEDYTVRDQAYEQTPNIALAQPGRDTRRESLAYLSQMTDFQLADEESPARVEFADQGASAAWRPSEAFNPFVVDATVRQINAFAADSPFPGSNAQMDFSLITGDQADNQQRNEMVWVRDLLEGNGPTNFNSGSTDPGDYDATEHPSCAPYDPDPSAGITEAPKYTGVQDYDDYPVAGNTYYYDPDNPQGDWLADGFPTWTGLMDRAQQISFTPAGLDVPFYVTNGNHDALVQGNEDATAALEDIVLGCFKALGATISSPGGSFDNGPDPNLLFFPLSVGMLVPPDPQRQFVSKPQVKDIFAANDPGEEHGFGFVDPGEEAASNGSASYYAWDPPQTPGFRFISIDTNSEGGQTAEGVASGSANGNIDDPQFQWLQAELEAAQASNKLIVIFGHHPVRSMNTAIADEQAPPCTGADDGHGHDPNPGCDLDPRISQPLHFGDGPSPGRTFVSLLSDYPNVIAYVPGHTHEHRLTPFPRTDGTTWWELNTSATADHPNQSRLMEMFDNHDGTLSIFTNVFEHGSASTAPAGGNASAFDADQLASIGRTLQYNDPQNNFSGEGAVDDRNAELLLDDPRDGVPFPPGGENAGAANATCKGKQATIVGTDGKDNLTGTPGDDVIVAAGGKDKVSAGKGDDVICGNGGRDTLRGNGGDDNLRGGGGKDQLKGGGGSDSCGGGAGRDVGRSCESGRDADD